MLSTKITLQFLSYKTPSHPEPHVVTTKTSINYKILNLDFDCSSKYCEYMLIFLECLIQVCDKNLHVCELLSKGKKLLQELL